ncbi:hypothetical protein RB2150_16734 [Rhodobacterales bacterium HTCC2150]|nr:hypothetical protein RB2150_16734 [Rhodobacterales bacterium HTCC2150] [Rhodobacteraceae bacterium HTCC2150]
MDLFGLSCLCPQIVHSEAAKFFDRLIMTPFVFHTTPSIEFGVGGLNNVGALAKPILGDRVLIVTDPGIAALGLVERTKSILQAANIAVEVFDDVQADPPEQVILDATSQAVQNNCTGIIGLGGGSSLDVAKLVAVLSKRKQCLADIYGVGNVAQGRLPLMLVPTTSGTGSEVTKVSIVTTGASEKMGVVSPVLLPDVALLDPELTYGLPAHITAATGIDAMVHAIEAYASINPNNNPISKGLAVQALQLMLPQVLNAVNDPGDKSARADMMLGSMLAGQAFANSPVAAVHALAYPIGGHFKVPHGLSNALVLPHVLRFNCETAPDVYAELAAQVLPDAKGATGFVDHLAALSAQCGLQQGLREIGIKQDDLPMMARDAMNQTRLLVNNPRPLNETDALAIYKEAF